MTEPNTFAVAADEVGQMSAKKLTSGLRRQAYANGWPVELSRQLVVSHEDSKFSVTMPPKSLSAVFDMEFGTQDAPPNPVIRRFMNRLDNYSDNYDNGILKVIEDMDIF